MRTCVHCSRTLPADQLRAKRLFGRLDGQWECRDTRECFQTLHATRGDQR